MGDPPDTSGAITLTERFLARNAVPFIPVMGEYHFARDERMRWRTELQAIRAGGITIVSTYLIWILHEEVEGEFRWAGNHDLRAFIELAAEVGLDVVVRVGPWAHGEARNGGFPDWLQRLPIVHRTNDHAYLTYVARWFDQIAQQTRGLFHGPNNPSGPIIGMQLENELYEQPDHLRELRRMCEDRGMRPSLWTATGWGGADLPPRLVLPVYAAYSDGFWESSDIDWPVFGPTHFIFSHLRDDLSVGADVRGALGTRRDEVDAVPFAMCELGGGMQVAYHRRPLVDPQDISAIALTKLGSGSAWQGYYLYHGATQVIGNTTTQESHATGYPNDLPQRDYDFFAPISACGQPREHYHLLRQQHLMLAEWGERIARAQAYIPEPEGDLRWAVRADDESGFLFVNNHQPHLAPLPEHHDVSFRVDLPSSSVVIPSTPVTIPSGAQLVWPLRQSFAGLPPVSATAQPLTEIETAQGPVVFFAAAAGIPVEFHLDGDIQPITGAAAVRSGSGIVLRPDLAPGPECVITIETTRFVVLDPASAARFYRFDVDATPYVVIWNGLARLSRDLDLELVISSPSQNILIAGGRFTRDESVFTCYTSGAAAVAPLAVTKLRGQAAAPPVRHGGSMDRLSAPLEGDWQAAAEYRLDLPASALAPTPATERVIVRVDWTGDVARAWVGAELVSDSFWSGRPWEFDVAPFRETLADGIRIEAFAWNPDAGVYVDARVRPHNAVLELRSATLTSTAVDRINLRGA